MFNNVWFLQEVVWYYSRHDMMDRNFKYVRQIGRWTLHTFEEYNIITGAFSKNRAGWGKEYFSKNIRGHPLFCVIMHAMFAILWGGVQNFIGMCTVGVG